jgi:selT/selW/selH-like putative selenoprotein
VQGFDDARVELDRGSGGVFDVFVDGDLVYSKADTGRFPDKGEVSRILKAR